MAATLRSRFQKQLRLTLLTAIPALGLVVLQLSFLPTFSLGFDPSHSSFNSSDEGVYSTNTPWLEKKLNLPPKNLTMSDVFVGMKCDPFSGSWVYDLSYPLYDWRNCPYIDAQFSCQRNGRPDSDYEKWRWKPTDCNLSRFNALYLLENIAGKTIMFVGDSLNRDQWQSMICLLNAALPQRKTSFTSGDTVSTFKALDYGVSVSFYKAPFLVDIVTTFIEGQEKVVLWLVSAEINGRAWKGADVLVFNSGHWWLHTGKTRGWDFMQEEGRLFEDMDPMVAYEKGLTTWANWIDLNIDTRITGVFFRSFSPAHDSSNQNGHNCYNETEPIVGSSYPGPYPPQFEVAEGVVKGMKSPVTFLNITALSLLRKDGHPSIYGRNLTVAQRSNPNHYVDCNHWCLPGIPDIWNELLYSSLVLE